MMTSLILLFLIAALGVASALGRTADSRDREYDLGRILVPRRRPTHTL